MSFLSLEGIGIRSEVSRGLEPKDRYPEGGKRCHAFIPLPGHSSPPCPPAEEVVSSWPGPPWGGNPRGPLHPGSGPWNRGVTLPAGSKGSAGGSELCPVALVLGLLGPLSPQCLLPSGPSTNLHWPKPWFVGLGHPLGTPLRGYLSVCPRYLHGMLRGLEDTVDQCLWLLLDLV